MRVTAELKQDARRFLRDMGTECSLTHANDAVDIASNGVGISLLFTDDITNDDGDPLTASEKAEVVAALQSLVDNHNSSL